MVAQLPQSPMLDAAVTAETTLSTFVASDGDNLAVQDWPLEPGQRLRGVVIVVHGLGEHAGRYDHVARRFNHWGFAVRSYDQYGHGESGGPRGVITSDDRLLDDLADIVDSTRLRMKEGTPLILLGHSMGGAVASQFVAMNLRPMEALILSSPALDPGLNAFQKLLLAILPKIAPNLAVGNGLDVMKISHDQAVIDDYKKDRLVHDRISPRLGRYIANAGAAVLAAAPRWTLPTLLMYAGADALVNPEGSRQFSQTAPKKVVTSRCFDDLYHEIFNELEAENVFAQLKAWLDERF